MARMADKVGTNTPVYTVEKKTSPTAESIDSSASGVTTERTALSTAPPAREADLKSTRRRAGQIDERQCLEIYTKGARLKFARTRAGRIDEICCSISNLGLKVGRIFLASH